ncbi:hypothetical protein J6590_043547 [Homalodisca vitripennis]|nr:hypothetical protein J6590_043547 [Homalodisca vitripennis]
MSATSEYVSRIGLLSVLFLFLIKEYVEMEVRVSRLKNNDKKEQKGREQENSDQRQIPVGEGRYQDKVHEPKEKIQIFQDEINGTHEMIHSTQETSHGYQD